MKTIKTEITINASKEKVWEVLMNHEKYQEWNPFIRKISGDDALGKQLHIEINQEGGKSMKFEPLVLVNEPQEEFRWRGKLFVEGIFDGEHYFQLKTIGEKQTQFIHGENFTGLFSGLLLQMIGEDTQKGFEEMNVALKRRVEANY